VRCPVRAHSFYESQLPIIIEARLWNKGDEPMINPLPTNAAPAITPKADADLMTARIQVKAAQLTDSSEKSEAKLQTPTKDSVQLSPSAQARAMRQAGRSIPQIAIKLGLAIPTVAAFFEE